MSVKEINCNDVTSEQKYEKEKKKKKCMSQVNRNMKKKKKKNAGLQFCEKFTCIFLFKSN